MINVASVIKSAALGNHEFTVVRGTGKFVAGEWQADVTKSIPMRGKVSPSTAKEIQQLPEGDRVTEALTFYAVELIYTTHNDARRGTSDVIKYRGQTYRVSSVYDRMAHGYCKAVAVRMSGD